MYSKELYPKGRGRVASQGFTCRLERTFAHPSSTFFARNIACISMTLANEALEIEQQQQH